MPGIDGLQSCTFAGVRVLDVGQAAALSLLRQWATSEVAVAVHLCNAYTLTLAARSTSYAAVLNEKSANLPDGVPVAWFSKMQTGRRSWGAVRGASLMRAAMHVGGLRHFFLGGSDGVLNRLHSMAVGENPDVIIAGMLAPPFGPLTTDQLREWSRVIRQSKANVVWVGLGTPKQDEVLSALVEDAGTVMVAVGAAFDFLSGAKREAPGWLQGSGFEWLYRLMAEPKRLWRRYLVGNEMFLYYAAKELVGRQAVKVTGRCR